MELDRDTQRRLLFDWFAHLARQSGLTANQYGSGGSAFNLGAPGEFQVTANFVETTPFLDFVAHDPTEQHIVDGIVPTAVDRALRGDLGGVVWYFAELHEVVEPDLSFSSFVNRLLQHQSRITGWHRLGGILLDFREVVRSDFNQEESLFAPPAAVHVYVSVPGPCEGHFSSHLAHTVIETVRAICGFALGRPLALPPMLVPPDPDLMTELVSRQTDQGIPELHRRGVSLDIFSALTHPGGSELFERARAALLTFDAAATQERDDVACILYVAAAECLAVPNTEWRRRKLTKRFVELFDELMPAELDRITSHDNFEDVFHLQRGTRTSRALRRALLESMYDFRSGHIHEGLRPTFQGLGSDVGVWDHVRRELFAEFAEGAILRYLAAPRSSLVGHPTFG
jgi:hypothetical protein